MNEYNQKMAAHEVQSSLLVGFSEGLLTKIQRWDLATEKFEDIFIAAIKAGENTIVEYFLLHNKDIVNKSIHQDYPILWAIYKKRYSTFLLLLRYGACLDVYYYGNAFHFAYYKCSRIFQYMVDNIEYDYANITTTHTIHNSMQEFIEMHRSREILRRAEKQARLVFFAHVIKTYANMLDVNLFRLIFVS